jgi:hypothetical protein
MDLSAQAAMASVLTRVLPSRTTASKDTMGTRTFAPPGWVTSRDPLRSATADPCSLT